MDLSKDCLNTHRRAAVFSEFGPQSFNQDSLARASGGDEILLLALAEQFVQGAFRMALTPSYRIVSVERRYSGFLSIDVVTFEFIDAQGVSHKLVREVLDRGNSAAVLLFNTDQLAVVLVRQMRIAAATRNSVGDALLLELPAGVIDTSKSDQTRLETPEEAARREAEEETGYVVEKLERIAEILPSPGGCSERIYIYYGEVKDEDRRGTALPDSEEKIEVVHLPLKDFFAIVSRAGVVDAKLMIAAQWLKPRRDGKATAALPPGGLEYVLADKAGHSHRKIGIRTGRIDDIHGMDAWVNAENTDMIMDRIFERSISARIRHLGAAKNLDSSIHADTIAEALSRKMLGRSGLKAGDVIVTTSGELRHTHDVKCLLHVACVQHLPGGAISTDPKAAACGLRNALAAADNRNTFWWQHLRRHSPISSVLVPLIGAGKGGATPEAVANELVPVALEHLLHVKRPKQAQLKSVYFIAYNERELEVLTTLLKQYCNRGVLNAPTQISV